MAMNTRTNQPRCLILRRFVRALAMTRGLTAQSWPAGETLSSGGGASLSALRSAGWRVLSVKEAAAAAVALHLVQRGGGHSERAVLGVYRKGKTSGMLQ